MSSVSDRRAASRADVLANCSDRQVDGCLNVLETPLSVWRFATGSARVHFLCRQADRLAVASGEEELNREVSLKLMESSTCLLL
jgi:hypothetical protein